MTKRRPVHPMLIVAGIAALLAIPGRAHAQNGLLKVTSFPSGASVTVDGAPTGKVTPMNISLSVGSHAVVVAIPNSGWQTKGHKGPGRRSGRAGDRGWRGRKAQQVRRARPDRERVRRSSRHTSISGVASPYQASYQWITT